MSRYPTNQAILAEEGAAGLAVQFLERVFMRSALSYKAAVYQDKSFSGFWTGKAVDRQSNSASIPSPDYWIKGFLASDFLITPKAGTKQLAVALKAAISSTQNLDLKSELIAASTLARRQAGKPMSVDIFCQKYQLSEEAATLVRQQLPNASIATQQFKLDATVFDAEVAYRNMTLDSGVTIAAPARDFDRIVARSPASGEEGAEEFSVTGRVVNERLRKGAGL